MLCGLDMTLCPRTVLFKGVAEPLRLASECQARGRGSTRAAQVGNLLGIDLVVFRFAAVDGFHI
jgi:hypothetical protein